MKKRKLLILTNTITGLVLLGGGLQSFGTFKSYHRELNHKADNLFARALPSDFFGEYGHAKFGEETTTHKIVGTNPDSKDYLYHHATAGDGQKVFFIDTGVFNKATIFGYRGKYYDEYRESLFNEDYINGFGGLDPYGTLLDLCYYLEDGIVGNVNEMQGYDDIVGRQIRNDDISLAGDGKTILTDANQLEKVLIKDYRTFASEISIGNKNSSLGYVYQFLNQPLHDEPIYDAKNDDGVYQIYPLDRVIFSDVDEKINAIGKITKAEAHSALKEYAYQNEEEFESLRLNMNQYYTAQKNKLSGFEFLANELIYQGLNRTSPLVIQNGGDYVRANSEILSDPLQTYQKGFVALKDYEVLYEVSSNQKDGKEANTYGDFHGRLSETSDGKVESDPLNLNLDDIDYLRITVKFNDTYRTEVSQVSETFFPKFEGGISEKPDNNKNQQQGGFIPLILIIVTILFSIASIFVKKWFNKTRS